MVAHLGADGYSTSEMAEIFQVNHRTIERDRKAIRESGALKSDPELAEIMIGQLASEAELAIQRIRRAIRDKSTSASTRIDAEHRCYQIRSDLIQRMQSLAYLPTAAHRVAADVMHHMAEVPDYPEMESQLKQLEMILPEESEALGQIHDRIERAQCAEKIDEISSNLPKQGDDNEVSE